MVSRRWWRTTTVLLLTGVLTPAAWGAGAPALKSPSDFESAKPDELPAMRDEYVKAFNALGTTTERDRFAGKVAADFSAPNVGVNSKRDDVRLNVVIMFHDLNSYSMEKPFSDLLNSNDPTVRYWSAKSLNELAPKLVSNHIVGGSPRALVRAARKPEA